MPLRAPKSCSSIKTSDRRGASGRGGRRAVSRNKLQVAPNLQARANAGDHMQHVQLITQSLSVNRFGRLTLTVNDTLMTLHFHSGRGLGLLARVTHTDFIWNYKTGRFALANNKNIYTSRRLATSAINQTVISRRADPRSVPGRSPANASIPQNKISYMCHSLWWIGRPTDSNGDRGGRGWKREPAAPNVTSARGNLYTIYQLIELGKCYCLMVAQSFRFSFNIYRTFSLQRRNNAGPSPVLWRRGAGASCRTSYRGHVVRTRFCLYSLRFYFPTKQPPKLPTKRAYRRRESKRAGERTDDGEERIHRNMRLVRRKRPKHTLPF